MSEDSEKLLSPKAGYGQYTSPNNCHNKQKVPEGQCSTVLSPSVILSSEALQYWQKELSNRDEKTAIRYLQYFAGFFEFPGKNPDAVIAQREKDQLEQDKKCIV